MRAKRSKKYRKLMQQYEVAFGFREPYQVLVDSHFLKAVHSFRMEFGPALERTLQGKVKPFITRCTLNALTTAAAKNPSPAGSDARTHPSRQARPVELPPPTELPLRYCKHNEEEKPIDEADCLLSLLAPKESDGVKKNKEHYILATADPIPPKQANKARPDRRKEAEFAALQKKAGSFRWQARQIPGVPIIYVKRSVMILEPLSGGSERVRENVEREKFREGIKAPDVVVGKRKRDDDVADKPAPSKTAKKVKGPNPLSVKKPKKKDGNAQGQKKATSGEQAKKKERENEDGNGDGEGEGEDTTGQQAKSGEKSKRKRRHKSRQTHDTEEKNTEVNAESTGANEGEEEQA